LIAMRSILSGQEEERKRIAQDLHDNIGTLMTTIKMKYIAIQRQVKGTSDNDDAAIVDDMLDQAASEIRRISYNMTPVAMDLTGLQGAVEDLESQLNLANIKSVFSIKDLDQIQDREKQVIVFRILQELVSNACRHSRASEAKVSTSILNDVLYLSVSDNGQGMSLSEWERGEGMGVRNIQSRVQYLDGTVSMSSANGTHFEIEIPV